MKVWTFNKNNGNTAAAFAFLQVVCTPGLAGAITSDRIFCDDPFGNDFRPPRFLIHHCVMNEAFA